MKKPLVLLVGGLFAGIAATAQANHLGPIEYGKERVEQITYCMNLQDSLLAVTAEQKSIESGESFEAMKERLIPLLRDKKCGYANVRYTPQETICEGKSYVLYSGGKTKIEPTRIVRSISGGREFYAHVGDEVTDKPPNCSEMVK